jgi:hypothetical protein
MNFDLYYSYKKPLKLSKKEKDKLLDIIFRLNSNKDKKIELYLMENWNKLLGKYANKVELKYVKNEQVYVNVESKYVLQEILFMIPNINQKMYLAIGEKIKTIKEIPLYKIKNQEILEHSINKIFIQTKPQEQHKKVSLPENNKKLIEEIKKILRNQL